MNAGPLPRPGLRGLVDRVVGPGASRGELLLNIVPALAAAFAAPIYAAQIGVDWSAFAYVVAALLALDLVGGVATTASRSGRRWYHGPDHGAGRHLAFIVPHILHLVLVSWLFLDSDVLWVVVAGGYLLAAALAVLAVPADLRRPLAMLAYAGSLVLALFVLAAPLGLEWFLPIYYLKLLVSYLSGT